MTAIDYRRRLALHSESTLHVVQVPRAVVERMLARAEARLRKEKLQSSRDSLGRLTHYLRAGLRDHWGKAPAVELKQTADYFAWVASVACDGVDGMLIGRQLSIE
jgi:hypothetical protein